VWLHKDVFDDPETPDYIWVPEVARRGWIVITKDAALLTNPKQLMAWYRSKARVFVFTGGNASGARMTEAIMKALRRMERIIAGAEPPFLVAVHLNGTIRPVKPDALPEHMLFE
jgi:PIN like domain